MAEYLDIVKLEFELSEGIWTDVTEDVAGSLIKFDYGIHDNDPLSRVAEPGEISFAMKDGSNNSAGLAGYYTPGHANVRTGFAPGIQVRLYIEYEGQHRYKFKGRIPVNGIFPPVGKYGQRMTVVTSYDWMEEASRETLSDMTVQTNQRIDQVVSTIVSGMVNTPDTTDYEVGSDVWETAFDTIRDGGTRVLTEFQKLAMCEYGYIYVYRDDTYGEVLKVESRFSRTGGSLLQVPVCSSESSAVTDHNDQAITDHNGENILDTLLQDVFFDNSILPSSKYSYGEKSFNEVKGVVYPRKVDTSIVTLWELNNRIELEPGESRSDIRASYSDPDEKSSSVTAKEMVDPPVSGTDYSMNSKDDGTGTDLTEYLQVSAVFYADHVDWTIENTHASTTGFVSLKARGKGIYHYDSVTVVSEDLDSQNSYGRNALSVNLYYQDSPNEGRGMANMLLGTYKDPDGSFDEIVLRASRDGMHMGAFLYLEPGSLIKVSEELTGEDEELYFVNGFSGRIYKIAGGWSADYSLDLIKKSKVSFWKLGVPGYSELGDTTRLAW